MNAAETFRELVGAVLRRYCVQNGQTVPAAVELDAFAARLWTLVGERGLPRPLAAGDPGAPSEMAEAECAALVARVLDDPRDARLAEPARQLVKACFYPEFVVCRDSFCAATPDGACRRQELARTRKRVSGAHCVDCPYWLSLDGAAHADLLRQHWHGDPDTLRVESGVFLPEDFRALRRWIRQQAAAKSGALKLA